MNNHLYLGIDVSKGYADFQLLDENKKPLEAPFRLEDTPEGRKQLHGLLNKWMTSGTKRICCGAESTGGYENNWIYALRGWSAELSLKVARLNPAGVKAVGEAAGTRTVTDAVSARHIAVFMIGFPEKVHWLAPANHDEETFSEARKLYGYIKMLDKQQVQLGNQLEKLLYDYFAPWMIYTRHGVPQWMLRLLADYPGRRQVCEAGETQISRIKGISMGRAKALAGKIADHEKTPGQLARTTIAQTARQMLHLKELMARQKKILLGHYKDHPLVELLQSAPGIGLQTAVTLFIEIEDIARFANAKKLASYFGLHPAFKQSGDGQWRARMSKKGRPAVRGALYMAGLTAIRYDEAFSKLYNRFRDQGMNHYQAMGVVMHKLLRVVSGIWSSRTPYNPRIDEANKSRSRRRQADKAVKGQHSKKKLHRYQQKWHLAPRSRRSVKKMKEQQASQSSLAEEHAGSPTAPLKI